MKASWEKLESNVGVLTIEVEAEEVNEALDKAFKRVVGRVNVPGFRRGKVPRHIFEARFGVESLYQDALDILLPEAYAFAVKETGIEPIARPDVDIERIAKNEPLKLTAKVQVKPEVKLGEYKGLEYEPLSTEVAPEEIDEELKRLQERHAELVAAEEGSAAEKGDIAVIDYEGFIDGEPLEGGKGEKHRLELGSGTFIEGFEDGIIGMKAGEEKEIEVTFPAEYHTEKLQGKKAVFKVKLHELKRKVLPELNDDFAADVSEFETLEEFKRDLEEKLRARKEREARAAQEQALIEQAAANATVDIPEIMVENALNRMVLDFGNRLRMQGYSLEMYYQMTNSNEQALREQWKSDAEKRVRQSLVLEAIAKKEQLTATDEDLEQELERMAEQFQRPKEEIRRIFENNGRLDDIREDLTIRRTIDFLVEHSKAKQPAKS